MKKYKYLISVFVVVVGLSGIASIVISAERGERSGGGSLAKLLGVPNATMSNVNRVAAWYSSNGEQERIPTTQNSGLYFPRGTTTAIYSAGLVWGGIYNDGRTPALRVNGQSYANGTKPGAILGIRTGVAEDPGSADVRIWRIRKDYFTADLRQDAAEINSKAISSVTDADIQAARDQYEKDWREWPWQKGAPFYDAEGDGAYTPGFNADGSPKLAPQTGETYVPAIHSDEPGVARADQVLWYVCNDIGVAQPWTCPESGMEEQTMIWAYDRADALGSVIFKRFRLIYKGVASTPANATIDSMYMCQWSDPDLGTFTDDFVGCDTTLSLGYVYNATASDGLYSQFGLVPPAAGYDFLQGPIVPGAPTDSGIFDLKRVYGKRNLPMTSFIFFAAGDPLLTDPPFSYAGAIMWYQMLRGLPPRPQGPPDPAPWNDPTTSQPTSFWVNGNPITGMGWIDGMLHGPGDRRMLLSSGPFTMAVGDTQELVSALVAGIAGAVSNPHLASIAVMKFHDSFVQTAYDSLFNLPGPPARPRVQAYGFENKILLDWEFDSASVARTEVKAVIGNYRFQGYKVYQFTDATADPATAILLAHFDSTNGITAVNQLVTDPINGQQYLIGVSLGEDNGVQRTFVITRDQVRGRPLANGQTYYFGVSAYNYSYDSLTAIGVPSYESSPTVVTAVPESPRPGTFYPYNMGDTISVRNEVGINDARVSPVVYNPATTSGETFHLKFDTVSAGNFHWTLTHVTSGRVLYSNITDLSGTIPFSVKESGFNLFVASPLAGVKSVTDAAGVNVFGPTSTDPTYAVLSDSGTLTGTLAAFGNSTGTGRNFEIRFDGTGSLVVRNAIVGTSFYRAPFSVWDVGRTPSDTSRQVVAYARWDLDAATQSEWNIEAAPFILNGVPYSVFEAIGVTAISYPDTATFAVSAFRTPIQTAALNGSHPNNAFRGVRIVARSGVRPPDGTTIRFKKYLELRPGDVKAITPTKVVIGDKERARRDVVRINAFPNPYYGLNRAETDRNVRFITFNHLPERAVIRIFNLSGTLVRTIDKTDPSQFQRWNLQNNNGLPVASGIYIVYIEMPDIGETKTLKVAIIQEQQFLRNY